MPLPSRKAAPAPRAAAKEGVHCTARARAASGSPPEEEEDEEEEEGEEEEEEEEEESRAGHREATAALIRAALASAECTAPRWRCAWARARSSPQCALMAATAWASSETREE